MFVNAFNLNRVFLRFIFQYLIFLSEKVIETISVQENACSNLFFDVLRLVREQQNLGKKSFFLIIDIFSNVFVVKTLVSQYV